MTGLPFDPVIRDLNNYLDDIDTKDDIDMYIEATGKHPCDDGCEFICRVCGFREHKGYRRTP